MIRVVSRIDGFNLYPPSSTSGKIISNGLICGNISNVFIAPKTERLSRVLYFSAFATWLPEQAARHSAYVKALESRGVTVIMGKFKEKDRGCKQCGSRWKGHEEKETDVNIALHLLDDAYQNRFDRALIVSRDSDIAPAPRLVRERFPNKKLTVAAPPRLGHSIELIEAATSKVKITERHIARCLLPEDVRDAQGNIVCERPVEYRPPVG